MDNLSITWPILLVASLVFPMLIMSVAFPWSRRANEIIEDWGAREGPRIANVEPNPVGALDRISREVGTYEFGSRISLADDRGGQGQCVVIVDPLSRRIQVSHGLMPRR